MAIDLSHIEAIVFDFGGVILNLDEKKTYEELSQILSIDTENLHEMVLKTKTFYDFECGKISSFEFIQFIHSLTKKLTSDQQIIDAWNAMLLELPLEHVDILLELKKHYRTFLLSNTNAIHEACFVQNIHNQGIPYTLEQMFETVWYSHVLGLRKPNTDIFIEITKRAQLHPHATLFLDDRADNIATAKKLGFQTQLITNTHTIKQIFNGF